LPNRWFTSSAAAAPASSAASSAAVHQSVDPAWWQVFHDTTLTSLVTRVADANLDVKTATVRLAESRFQRGAVASAQLPGLNGSARYQYQNLSNARAKGSLINSLPSGTVSEAPTNLFTSGFDASWELDLWGHVRRQVEAADAQVQYSEEQRRDALVSSLAETARDYIQLRGTQTLIRITNDNLKIQRDILQLTQTRQQKGLTSSLDVENAAAQVEAIRAQLPSLEQQQAEQINALSFLLDLPPDALWGELAGGRQVVPKPARVPIGIPSELARRRPDIRAAEAQLHAATADIGVAVAEFYPTIQLNGSAGFDALKIGSLLTANAILTNVGPSVSIPIFQGGRLKATLELRKAQQVETAIAYHRTVLQAWHEVVNALVAYRTERQRRGRLGNQVEHLRQALTLARDRYNDGVADFTTVLDIARTLLQAEQDSAQSTTNISINLVQLYKALGGGWELTYPAAPAEVPIADPRTLPERTPT
jgi:NodT family efflux transporter outer membrane factor (OMF) lipoprotein